MLCKWNIGGDYILLTLPNERCPYIITLLDLAAIVKDIQAGNNGRLDTLFIIINMPH